jgi:hypothetical protein
MMDLQLITTQIRVHDLDLEEILPQPVAENLSQAVRENGNSLLPFSPTAVGVFERS